MGNINKRTLATTLILFAISAHAEQQTGPLSHAASIDDQHTIRNMEKAFDGEYEFLLDIGFDSKYVSEGRNNLDNGGIVWTTASMQKDGLNVYATMGRGTDQHYIEWNFGLEYGFDLSKDIEASLGYQRLEFYGDERGHDNELFSTLAYTGVDWLTPSVSYTYATEAKGYFVEVSLHSHWDINDDFSISPYITQAFDFQYATEEHDGANHIQFGIEAEYVLTDILALSGHISHSIAQEDIEQENAKTSGLDETFVGGHITWVF